MFLQFLLVSIASSWIWMCEMLALSAGQGLISQKQSRQKKVKDKWSKCKCNDSKFYNFIRDATGSIN